MDRVGSLNHKYNGIKKQARNKKALKVVYISSPMKVKTSVSKFRALVQELTGRESDVARLMEINGVAHNQDRGFRHVDDYNNVFNNVPVNNTDGQVISSPASSGELSFDDLFAPYGNAVDESYTGVLFPAGFMYENSQADFLRSFDAAV